MRSLSFARNSIVLSKGTFRVNIEDTSYETKVSPFAISKLEIYIFFHDNGVRNTPKRRIYSSFLPVLCFKNSLLIHIFH